MLTQTRGGAMAVETKLQQVRYLDKGEATSLLKRNVLATRSGLEFQHRGESHLDLDDTPQFEAVARGA